MPPALNVVRNAIGICCWLLVFVPAPARAPAPAPAPVLLFVTAAEASPAFALLLLFGGDKTLLLPGNFPFVFADGAFGDAQFFLPAPFGENAFVGDVL